MVKNTHRGPMVLVVVLMCMGAVLFARYGLRNAVPASDGVVSDLLLGLLPQRAFTDQVLLSGGRPLWNPYVGLGNDESTTLWAYPYYPTTPLTQFLRLGLGTNLEIFLHLLLAFVGAYLFARRLDRSHCAACLSAVAFAGAGMLSAYCFAPPLLLSASWLPLLFYFTDRLVKSPSLLDATGLGICAGLHSLVGVPQYTLYFAPLLLAWILFQAKGNSRKQTGWALACLALSGIIAALIGAGKLLPWIVNADRMRAGYFDWEFFSDRLLSWRSLFAFISPRLFFDGQLLRQMDLRVFFGIIPLAAAILGACKLKAHRAVSFFVVVVGICAALTADWFLPHMLWKTSEFFAALTPTRMWLPAVFALSILAAFGLDYWASLKKQRAKKVVLYCIGAVAITAAVLFIGAVIGNSGSINLKAILPIAALAGLAVGTLVFSSNLRAGLAVILAAINAFAFFWVANPAMKLNILMRETPITSALKQHPGRVLRVGELYTFLEGNRVYEAQAFLPDRIFDLNTYALMPDKALHQAMEAQFGAPQKGTLAYYRRTWIRPVGSIAEQDNPLLDRLQVKYLLSRKELPGYALVAQEGRLRLYERPGNFNFLSFPNQKGEGNARVIESGFSPDSNSFHAMIDAKENTTVAFSQSYRDGWKGTINGQPLPLNTDDGLSILFNVPAGKSDVVLTFTAPYVKLADRMTSVGYRISVILLIVGIVLYSRRQIVNKRIQPSSHT